MVFVNVTNKYVFDISNTIQNLVSIISNVSIFKNNSSEIKNNENISFNEIIDITESIANILEAEHILSKEYYDFREIQRLLIKTLEDDLDNSKLEIILNILRKLVKINEYKLDLLNKYSNGGKLDFKHISFEDKEEFKNEYEKFHKFLFESKIEYYSISKSSSKIDSKKYFNLLDESILN